MREKTGNGKQTALNTSRESSVDQMAPSFNDKVNTGESFSSSKERFVNFMLVATAMVSLTRLSLISISPYVQSIFYLVFWIPLKSIKHENESL